MKTFLLMIGTAVAWLMGVAAVFTARYTPLESPAISAAAVAIRAGAAERLAGAIRIPTISTEDASASEPGAFQAMHTYLEQTFPRVHSELEHEIVGGYSLFYTWRGADPALAPILLAGHMDVVPVEPNAGSKWKQDPFGGRIVDGHIWGRGTIDNKSTVLGSLEAVEMLLLEGFRPTRTVYLAYGHDEEVGGTSGALEMATLLKRRGVTLEMVVDEGGVVGDGILAGLDRPVALVGIAEKGFVTIELSARVSGGHSSLPPRHTAVGIVSAAVANVERNPMPARLEAPTRELFDRIGAHLPIVQRAVFANLWLTRPLVARRLEQAPITNAMVRTTAAPTIFQAGTKDNLLPAYARAVINFRILPNDSIAAVVEHVRRVVDDARVEIKVVGHFSSEPSEVSRTDSPSFRALRQSIRTVFPDVIVAPYLVVVATDARHYADLTRNVFRFLPLRLESDDLERMHGKDERIGIGEYEMAIRTYREVVVNASRIKDVE